METKYLGLIISTNDIKIDFAKVKAIYIQNTSINMRKMQLFIRFYNFYYKFI